MTIAVRNTQHTGQNRCKDTNFFRHKEILPYFFLKKEKCLVCYVIYYYLCKVEVTLISVQNTS